MVSINANVSGIQAQVASVAFKQMVRAVLPYMLKILDGARDSDLVHEWVDARAARSGGVLMLRLVTGDDVVIEDMPGLVTEAIQTFWGWQHFARPARADGTGGVMVVLEIPINEKFHTNLDDFARLVEETVACCPEIIAAGFVPGVLITSEGNPPGAAGDTFGMQYFLQPHVLACLRKLRAMGAVWCPHGYSHPPSAAADPYHFQRPGLITGQLPADARLNYIYGEFGCDGGCDIPNKKPGRGWQDYFDTPRAYGSWLRQQVRCMAADPYCLGGALFLSGADPNGQPNFTSFDIGDEVDIRGVFTDIIGGPARVRLVGTGAATGGSTVPVVNGFTVGQGVADKLAAQKDKPLSNEQYVGDKMSFTFSEKGFYVYSKDASKTYFVAAK